MEISQEDRATVEKILNDMYLNGIRDTLSTYYYKTAHEWLSSSPPRKVVDAPLDVVNCNKLSFDGSEYFYYAAIDTAPCSDEEAKELIARYGKDINGLVWWRKLTEVEQNPKKLIFGTNCVNKIDCSAICDLI